MREAESAMRLFAARERPGFLTTKGHERLRRENIHQSVGNNETRNDALDRFGVRWLDTAFDGPARRPAVRASTVKPHVFRAPRQAASSRRCRATALQKVRTVRSCFQLSATSALDTQLSSLNQPAPHPTQSRAL
jgi:hypothetical protein